MTEGSDKRRHHRIMALLAVHVLPGDRVPPELKLATIDIALGGARCAANVPVAKETRLQLTFTLVGGDLQQPEPIDVDAVVLRCSERPGAPPHLRYVVALEFKRIDARDKKLLQSYLNAL